MPLPNQGMDFTPFDTLPAADLDKLVENIESLEDGSGFDLGNNVIPAKALSASAITLGHAQITSNYNTGGIVTNDSIDGLTIAVTIPAGSRRIEIEVFTGDITVGGGTFLTVTIWDGNVGSGTQLAHSTGKPAASDVATSWVTKASVTPAAGAKTYNASISSSAQAAQVNASATGPAYITVRAV